MAAPSFNDYFNTGKAEALSRRPDLTFDDGDISEMYMSAGAAMADHLTGYSAERIKATYLDGATEGDLTVLADDRYNIQRQQATFATGQVTFSRLTSSAGAGTIVAGTVVATAKDATGNEIQFMTMTNLNVGSGATGALGTVDAVALLTGVESNVAAGTVNRIVSSVYDSTITVTNAARFAGGDVEQSDESLRAKVRGFPTTIRRATLAALEYGALNTTGAGVSKATAVEDTDLFGEPTGIVSLFVTDSTGSSSAPMTTAVAGEMVNWRAAGVIVNVQGGVVLSQNVTLALSFRAGSGISTSAIQPTVEAAVAARINKLKIGETLSPDIIKQAACNVDPDNILSCAVSIPAGDVVPAGNQIIRCGAVTVGS